jgi:hypothetical protein
MGKSIERLKKPPRMSPPLSRSNQTRLLRSLNLRAAAGDVAAAEAVLRLGILAHMKIGTAAPIV